MSERKPQHIRLIARIILLDDRECYRIEIMRRLIRPPHLAWADARILFRIRTDNDWVKHSYMSIVQARRELNSLTAIFRYEGAQIDDATLRIVVNVRTKTVRKE